MAIHTQAHSSRLDISYEFSSELHKIANKDDSSQVMYYVVSLVQKIKIRQVPHEL